MLTAPVVLLSLSHDPYPSRSTPLQSPSAGALSNLILVKRLHAVRAAQKRLRQAAAMNRRNEVRADALQAGA
jgi:hypothetical protein